MARASRRCRAHTDARCHGDAKEDYGTCSGGLGAAAETAERLTRGDAVQVEGEPRAGRQFTECGGSPRGGDCSPCSVDGVRKAMAAVLGRRAGKGKKELRPH